MDEGTYLKKRIEGLREDTDELLEVGDGVQNEFNTWSALKLILHSAAVTMYTDTHHSQGTGDIYYIDALSGSGISSYDDTGQFIGSPLVAAKAATAPFSKMYFIEQDESNANALRKRLEWAFTNPKYTEPDDWKVFSEDANEKIPEVIEEIENESDYNDRFNYYCFIDNESLDITWSSIEALTPKPYGDLLINLPTAHAIGRCANQDSFDSLNAFYGRDMSGFASGPVSRSSLYSKYENQVKDRGRSVTESVKVRTDTASFYYDMMYATRFIENGNGYMDVVRYVKQFLERVDSGDVDRMLRVLNGDQQTIADLQPDEDVSDKLPEIGEQTGLQEFF